MTLCAAKRKDEPREDVSAFYGCAKPKSQNQNDQENQE